MEGGGARHQRAHELHRRRAPPDLPHRVRRLSRYPRVDLEALVAGLGIDLGAVFTELTTLYLELDERNARNTKDLALPCHRGCDACCHESVFLTPLEFLAGWDYAQTHLDDERRDEIVRDGLALYAQHRATIDALDAPPPSGAKDHGALARTLRFRCPLLSRDGACSIYPRRELFARLFGCSFNAEGGVYGCHLVGAHLADKTVTLVSTPRAVERLARLPLTGKRQVYPYYLQLLYGA